MPGISLKEYPLWYFTEDYIHNVIQKQREEDKEKERLKNAKYIEEEIPFESDCSVGNTNHYHNPSIRILLCILCSIHFFF